MDLLDKLMRFGWLDYTDIYVLTRLDRAAQINRADIVTLKPSNDAKSFWLDSMRIIARAEFHAVNPQNSAKAVITGEIRREHHG